MQRPCVRWTGCLRCRKCSGWSLPCGADYVDGAIICACLCMRPLRVVLLLTKAIAATRAKGLRGPPLFISHLTRKPISSAWPLRSGGFMRHLTSLGWWRRSVRSSRQCHTWRPPPFWAVMRLLLHYKVAKALGCDVTVRQCYMHCMLTFLPSCSTGLPEAQLKPASARAQASMSPALIIKQLPSLSHPRLWWPFGST